MRHGVGRRSIEAAFYVFLTVALAACTTSVDGTAVRATGPQGSIDVDQFDVGPYPTQPREPLGVAGDPAAGVVLEAKRMANNVIGPWEVDPDLKASFAFG